jgi:hypothetical protein
MAATTLTRKEKVLSYLKKNRRYVPGYELTTPEVGGTEGLRRLRELRADGTNIISRKNPETGIYEYKIGRK